jgi:carboxylesterase
MQHPFDSSQFKAQSASFSIGTDAAQRHVIILHGYTGSPDEFRSIAEELSTRFDAYVSVPLLPGHGTDERDLLHVTFDHLLDAARNAVLPSVRAGKNIVIMGHSFGAYLALLLAAEFKITALILTVIPYHLRFPLSIPGFGYVTRMKTLWKKTITDQEREERKGMFYYDEMPGIALSYVQEGIRRVNKILSRLSLPVLTINNREDPIAYADSGERVASKTADQARSQCVVMDTHSHGVFYGPRKKDVEKHIVDFLTKVFT